VVIKEIPVKIDVYNHIFPKKFFDKMLEVMPTHADIGKRVRNVPVLVDLDLRFRMLEEFGDDYRQVLSLAAPPLELLGGPEVSPDLARIANDEMADLVGQHDRFVGFVAALPLNNMEATVAEIRRAIDELGANGVQMYTNYNGQPLDVPELLPVFELMAEYDLPIWVHPIRPATFPDYVTEEKSKYEIWWTFGWPYESSAMMARLVFSGMFDRFPNLKIITHHLGGMVPYFEGRVGPGWDQLGSRTSDEDLSVILTRLKKRPLDYFKQFYADTAVFGSSSATQCGLNFFGADNVLFASDSPFDPERGPMYIRETIKIIDALDISDQERAQIYKGNAKRLLKLDLPDASS
jgi:predicted TIM-barrel fold metal-dependent hydrolase